MPGSDISVLGTRVVADGAEVVAGVADVFESSIVNLMYSTLTPKYSNLKTFILLLDDTVADIYCLYIHTTQEVHAGVFVQSVYVANLTNAHTCMHIHAHTQTHTYTHASTHTHVHMHIHTHARTHAHTHTRAHTHIRICAHTHTHASKQAK